MKLIYSFLLCFTFYATSYSMAADEIILDNLNQEFTKYTALAKASDNLKRQCTHEISEHLKDLYVLSIIAGKDEEIDWLEVVEKLAQNKAKEQNKIAETPSFISTITTGIFNLFQ